MPNKLINYYSVNLFEYQTEFLFVSSVFQFFFSLPDLSGHSASRSLKAMNECELDCGAHRPPPMNVNAIWSGWGWCAERVCACGQLFILLSSESFSLTRRISSKKWAAFVCDCCSPKCSFCHQIEVQTYTCDFRFCGLTINEINGTGALTPNALQIPTRMVNKRSKMGKRISRIVKWIKYLMLNMNTNKSHCALHALIHAVIFIDNANKWMCARFEKRYCTVGQPLRLINQNELVHWQKKNDYLTMVFLI